MITITACIPRQYSTVTAKLRWLETALASNKTDLFLLPQEYFGGIYPCPDAPHVQRRWLIETCSAIAKKHHTALGVGAAVREERCAATEDYFYFDRSGHLCGFHRKYALPRYDDVRAGGAGQLWPEVDFNKRARPIEIKELGLIIGTIFCWEVYSQALPAAYSYAGVNLIIHPIKFAPDSWPKVSKSSDGLQRINDFACDNKHHFWLDKLLFLSRFQTMCPIAVSCNSWKLGDKHMAMVGHVDEILNDTQIEMLPSVEHLEHLHQFSISPKVYTGMDHLFHMGAFRAHTGAIDHFYDLKLYTMQVKIRRLEAQLIGGSTRLTCALKFSGLNRQVSKLRKGLGVKRTRRVKKAQADE